MLPATKMVNFHSCISILIFFPLSSTLQPDHKRGLCVEIAFFRDAKGAIEKSWYFVYSVTIKVQQLLAVFMVVVANRVVVKKVFHVFSKQVNLGGGHLSGLKQRKLKIAVAWILFYPVLNR